MAYMGLPGSFFLLVWGSLEFRKMAGGFHETEARKWIH